MLHLFFLCFRVTDLAGKWHGFMRDEHNAENDVSMFLCRSNVPDFVYGSIWKNNNKISTLNESHVGNVRIFKGSADGIKFTLFGNNFSYSFDTFDKNKNFVAIKGDDESGLVTRDGMNIEFKKRKCRFIMVKYFKEKDQTKNILVSIFLGFLISFIFFTHEKISNYVHQKFSNLKH